jgi:hypothetical protein
MCVTLSLFLYDYVCVHMYIGISTCLALQQNFAAPRQLPETFICVCRGLSLYVHAALELLFVCTRGLKASLLLELQASMVQG